MLNLLRRLLGLCAHEWGEWSEIRLLSHSKFVCQVRVCKLCNETQFKARWLK